VATRVHTICLKAAVACALTTTTLYFLLVYTQVFRGTRIYEGWVFFVHVVLAIVGIPLGVLGWRRHPWLALAMTIVCGYFVLIQLVR
jgi:hypothetical protein